MENKKKIRLSSENDKRVKLSNGNSNRINLSDNFFPKSNNVHREHKVINATEKIVDRGSSQVANSVSGEMVKESSKNAYKAAKSITKGAVLSGTVGTIAYAKAASALGNKVLYGDKGAVANKVVESQLPNNSILTPNAKYFTSNAAYSGSYLAKSSNAEGIKKAYYKVDDFINGRGTSEIYISRNKILENRGRVILKDKGVGHFSKRTKIGKWKYNGKPLTDKQYAKMMSKFHPTLLQKKTDELKNHLKATPSGALKGIAESAENISLKAVTENGGTGGQAVASAVSTLRTARTSVKGVGKIANTTSRVTIGASRTAWNASKTAVKSTYKVSKGTVKATKSAAKLTKKSERAAMKAKLKKNKKKIGSKASDYAKKRIESLKKAIVANAMPLLIGGFVIVLFIIVPATIITSLGGILSMSSYTIDRKAFVAVNEFMSGIDADLQVELDTKCVEKLKARIDNGEINGKYENHINNALIYNDSYAWDGTGATLNEWRTTQYAKIHSDQIAYYDYINAKYPFANMNDTTTMETMKKELKKIWGDLQTVSILITNRNDTSKPIFDKYENCKECVFNYDGMTGENLYQELMQPGSGESISKKRIIKGIVNDNDNNSFKTDEKITVNANITLSEDYLNEDGWLDENGVLVGNNQIVLDNDNTQYNYFIHNSYNVKVDRIEYKLKLVATTVPGIPIPVYSLEKVEELNWDIKKFYRIDQHKNDADATFVKGGYISAEEFADLKFRGAISVHTFSVDTSKKYYEEQSTSSKGYYKINSFSSVYNDCYISVDNYNYYISKDYFSLFPFQTPSSTTQKTLYRFTEYYEQIYTATVSNTSMPMRTYLDNNIRTLVEDTDTFGDAEYWEAQDYNVDDALCRYEIFQEINGSETYAFADNPFGPLKIMAIKSRNGYYSDGSGKQWQVCSLYAEKGWKVYTSTAGKACVQKSGDDYFFIITQDADHTSNGDKVEQRSVYNLNDIEFTTYLQNAVNTAKDEAAHAESNSSMIQLKRPDGTGITLTKFTEIGTCKGDKLDFGAAFSVMVNVDGGIYQDYDVDVFVDSMTQSVRNIGVDRHIDGEEAQISAYAFLIAAEKYSRFNYYSGVGTVNGNDYVSYNEFGFVKQALMDSNFVNNAWNIDDAYKLYDLCPFKFLDGDSSIMGDLVFVKEKDTGRIKGIGIVADAKNHMMLIQLKSEVGESSGSAYVHYRNWKNSEFDNYDVMFARLKMVRRVD